MHLSDFPRTRRSCGRRKSVMSFSTRRRTVPGLSTSAACWRANRHFAENHPIATKRALRAFLKAADICAQDPARAARYMVDKGYEPRYEVAHEVLTQVSYRRWREANPEDTLRFYALRLHEVGMIKTNPNKLIAQGTDWRFLNELKRELKA